MYFHTSTDYILSISLLRLRRNHFHYQPLIVYFPHEE
nr:MAG TPA: hypothetical protein [Caudoviricetes sp.]